MTLVPRGPAAPSCRGCRRACRRLNRTPHGGVDSDEVAVVGALGDDAGDAAVAALFQLWPGRYEVDGVAQALNVLLEHLIAGLLGAAVVHLLDREHQLSLADLSVVRPLWPQSPRVRLQV